VHAYSFILGHTAGRKEEGEEMNVQELRDKLDVLVAHGYGNCAIVILGQGDGSYFEADEAQIRIGKIQEGEIVAGGPGDIMIEIK
jgi:hypothetical protein